MLIVIFIRKAIMLITIFFLLIFIDLRIKCKVILTKGPVPDEWTNKTVIQYILRVTYLLRLGKILEYSILPKKIVYPDSAFLLISNHQSLFDILLVFLTCCERNIRFIAKEELRYGFLGASHVMRLQNHIFVKRNSNPTTVKSNMEQITQGIAKLKIDTGIVIFPEGHRSKNRAVMPYKTGAIKHIQSIKSMPIVYMGIACTTTFREFMTFLFIPRSIRFRTQVLGIHYPKNKTWERHELIQTVQEIEHSTRIWVEEQEATFSQ